jgi:ferredoxin
MNGSSRIPSVEEADAVALEISVDTEKCMGSGNCSFWAPGAFDLNDDGVSEVIDAVAVPEEKILLAAQGCPTQAIRVTRDGTVIAP